MPPFFNESATGSQVGSSLALRIGVLLFLALCIVELIVFAQVCVCERARARVCVCAAQMCFGADAERTAAAQQYVTKQYISE
jgi:hypothetical protein